MKAEELKHLKVDVKYVFKLNSGRIIIRHGSWLLGVKDGHYAIDESKCGQIKKVIPYDEISTRNVKQ